MDLRLVTLKGVYFYLLHSVSTLSQRRKLSCGTVVCKHFDSYQGYPNYRWDFNSVVEGLIRLKSMDINHTEQVRPLTVV
jgi:hypothetical protein